MCCCPSICCIATRGTGGIRIRSFRSASHPITTPERPRFAYMPFAAGPRHCIGETFALYEMLMHLHHIARHFRLIHVPDKPIELEAQINLRTRHPLHMRLERR